MRTSLVCLLVLGALLAPTALAAGPLTAVSGRTIVVDPGHNPGNGRYPAEVNRPVDYGLGTKPCGPILSDRRFAALSGATRLGDTG